jgi:tetratricopeptide (TPR) repeat protein
MRVNSGNMSESTVRPLLQQPNQPKPPPSAEIVNRLQNALALHQQGQLGLARALYQKILKQQPDHFDALHMLGVIESQRKNFAGAILFIGRALKLNSNYAPAHSNMGNALRELGRHEEALASYDHALAIKPDYAEVLSNRGNTLFELRRHEEALASYERALAIKPD